MKHKTTHFCHSKVLCLMLSVLLLCTVLTVGIAAEDGSTSLTQTLENFWRTYSGEVLCALAFIGSILTGVLYKTGLLPLIKAALGALGEAVGKATDATEAFGKSAEAKIGVIQTDVEKALITAEASALSMQTVQEKLEKTEALLQNMCETHEKTTAILRTETELLYRMLQNVNLPQIQKDSMTESYLTLKNTLEEIT